MLIHRLGYIAFLASCPFVQWELEIDSPHPLLPDLRIGCNILAVVSAFVWGLLYMFPYIVSPKKD
jgi:hypothetical protein